MNNHLLPSDSGWTADKVLIAELSKLNTQVTRYILRHLDADARRAEPIRVEDERALAELLAVLATDVQARADRRQALGDQPTTIEGDIENPPAPDDGDQEQP